jgi:hypothetical protein
MIGFWPPELLGIRCSLSQANSQAKDRRDEKSANY